MLPLQFSEFFRTLNTNSLDTLLKTPTSNQQSRGEASQNGGLEKEEKRGEEKENVRKEKEEEGRRKNLKIGIFWANFKEKAVLRAR